MAVLIGNEAWYHDGGSHVNMYKELKDLGAQLLSFVTFRLRLVCQYAPPFLIQLASQNDGCLFIHQRDV